MIRRAADILGAIIILLLTLPFSLLIAAAIRIEGDGGVLYAGPRIGRRGRQFRMIKFRTMRPDGDSLLHPSHVEELNARYKLGADPRVTGVGRWLRRHSLDEIPQLLNVLAGDMSLVGPRPKLPGEIGLYGGETETLLSVRPGMTGLWQVSRTSANSDAFMRETDLRYVRTRSPSGDVRILLRTAAVIFKGGNS